MEEKVFTAINDLKKSYPNSWGDKKQFNVFTALRPISDEVYLHSRFISSLLDPNGEHGLNKIPLEKFLEEIGSSFICGENPMVRPNPRVELWKEEGEIDILIEGLVNENKEPCSIIVENKIYANDSNHPEKGKGQLQGYYHYLQNEKVNVKYTDNQIEVYYLTPNRHEPSKYSLTGDGMTYPQLLIEKPRKDKHPRNKYVRLIDYTIDISKWIEKVFNKVTTNYDLDTATKHNLQEALKQYDQVVKKLVGDIELNKKISNLVSTHFDEVKEMKYEILKELLGDRFIDVQWHAIDSFLNNLGNELQQLKIEVEGRSSHLAITDLLYHPSKHTPIYFRIKQNGIVWTLQADDRCREKGFFLGIDKETEPNKDNASEIQNLLSKIDSINPIVGWHTVKYLQGNTVEFNNENVVLPCLNFWDFIKGDTFDLLNEEKRRDIAKRYAAFVKQELNKL